MVLLLVSLLASQSPHSSLQDPTPAFPPLRLPGHSPRGRDPRCPGLQGVGGTLRSLTLVAVGQEVGAGP